MVMRQKLTPLEGDLLKVRVHISRTVGVFTLQEIRRAWDISTATMHRYVSEQYRELSREAARRQTREKAMSRGDRKACHTCKKSLFKHPRCEDCEILLHSSPEISLCDGCVRNRRIAAERERRGVRFVIR